MGDTISAVEEYHQYCGGIPSVLWRDTISTVGGTISAVGGPMSAVDG